MGKTASFIDANYAWRHVADSRSAPKQPLTFSLSSLHAGESSSESRLGVAGLRNGAADNDVCCTELACQRGCCDARLVI